MKMMEQYYNECLENNGVFFSLNLPEIQWTKMDTYRHIVGPDDSHTWSLDKLFLVSSS